VAFHRDAVKTSVDAIRTILNQRSDPGEEDGLAAQIADHARRILTAVEADPQPAPAEAAAGERGEPSARATTDASARETTLKDFFSQVAGGMVEAQKSLDAQSLEYIRAAGNGSAGAPLPALFRIPKVSAEISFGFSAKEGSGFNIIIASRTRETQQSMQNKVSFDLISVPPPPQVLERLHTVTGTPPGDGGEGQENAGRHGREQVELRDDAAPGAGDTGTEEAQPQGRAEDAPDAGTIDAIRSRLPSVEDVPETTDQDEKEIAVVRLRRKLETALIVPGPRSWLVVALVEKDDKPGVCVATVPMAEVGGAPNVYLFSPGSTLKGVHYLAEWLAEREAHLAAARPGDGT